MTKKQMAELHGALESTETRFDEKSGLPVCDEFQLMQRRSIIAEFDKRRREKSRR